MMVKLLCTLVMVLGLQVPFGTETLTLDSDHVFLMDADSGQVLINEGGDERIYPASMTKVMTALIVLENTDSTEETVYITNEMWNGLIEANASVAGFYPGSTPTVMDLLYGCLLPSGADAVNALCIHTAGDISSFVHMMNDRAAELGMTSTHYVNPTGLHHPDHVSTAHDTAVLFAYALRSDTFREIIGTAEYTTSEGMRLTSTVNAQAQSVPGFLGGKTGYTEHAGLCLASHAEINGTHLVLVTAHSTSPAGNLRDAMTVYAHYRAGYERRVIAEEGQEIAVLHFLDTKPDRTIRITVPEEIVMDLPQNARIECRTSGSTEITTPVQAGDLLYTYSFTVDGVSVYEQNIRATEDIKRNTLRYFLRITRNAVTSHPRFSVLCLLALILLLNRLRK